MRKTEPIDIEKITLENKERGPVIIFTDRPGVGGRIQIAVMSLTKGQDVPFETHDYVTQFVKVEKGGVGKISIEEDDGKLHDYTIKQGSSFTISSGKLHRILCTKGTLKMFTIYAKDSTASKWVH
jgi:quercetin dioxygenase-like cupin family protein